MDYSFINPYNFIPLGSAPKRGKVEKGNYSGVIEYTLLTKTPLFIPNTSNDHVWLQSHSKEKDDESKLNDHKSYDFFSYTDLSKLEGAMKAENKYKPVIPGSEIRGMFRANFEILTNSCMSAIDDKAIMSKRTAEVFKAGLIRKTSDGKYFLHEADDFLLREKTQDGKWGKSYENSNLTEGQKVKFEPSYRGKAKGLSTKINESDSQKIGYVIKGAPGPEMKEAVKYKEKHCCHIFAMKDGDSLIGELTEDELACLDTVLMAYEINGESDYSEYKRAYEKFKCSEAAKNEKVNCFPVYYSGFSYSNNVHGRDRNVKPVEKIFLSPAAITREVYQNKIGDKIGEHKTCSDGELCLACRLFGTLGNGSEDSAVSSRLRFSDLHVKEVKSDNDYYGEVITLEPLSSPKLNNMEFYLKRPTAAVFWTFDYYIDKEGKIYPNDDGINGRKFYWHNLKINEGGDRKSAEASNQNMTIRPVRKDIVFSGKLYFQNLSKDELDWMICLINCAEDSRVDIGKAQHGYKLGAAKPLGYGSVAVRVDAVRCRSVLRDNAKREICEYSDYANPKVDEIIKNHFTKMTAFNTIQQKNVCYPRLGEKGDIFK